MGVLSNAMIIFVLFCLACSNAKVSEQTKKQKTNLPPENRVAFSLSLLSVGIVDDTDKNLAYPLTPYPLPNQLDSILSSQIGGAHYVPKGDPRFPELAAFLPTYIQNTSYTAFFSEGRYSSGQMSGVAVFLSACAQLSVAPMIEFSKNLPEEGSPILIYRGNLGNQQTPSISTVPLVTNKTLSKPIEEFFATRPLRVTLPQEEDAFYSVSLSLDTDQAKEYFVARTRFEPLGDTGARTVFLEGFFLDRQENSWKVLAHQSKTLLSQQDVHKFSIKKDWELFLSPPVLVVDLDGDSYPEILRKSFTGYELWLFNGTTLSPSGVGYQAICD